MSTTNTSTTIHGTDPARGGRHPVDTGHLVMGLAFLCFTGAWALVQGDVVNGADARWLLPMPWLVGGAAGLAVIAIRSMRRASPSAAEDNPTDPHTDTLSDADTDAETDTEEIR